MTQDDRISKTIPTLRALIEIYQCAQADGHKDVEAWANYALHWACRGLEVFRPAARVSKAAAAKAVQNKIGDISGYRWSVQKTKMHDRERKIFHYEHVYPVSQLRRDLQRLKSVTDEDILRLIQRVDVAWILKEERKKLDAKYRSKRPDDPWEAFEDEEVGIEMMGPCS